MSSSNNFFFFLGKIHPAFRSFILGSVFSAYALILYYFDLGIKFTLNDLSYSFVVPLIISAIVFLVAPKKSGSDYVATTTSQNVSNKSSISKNGTEQLVEKDNNQVLGNSTIPLTAQKEQTPQNENSQQQPQQDSLKYNVNNPELNEKVSNLKNSLQEVEKKVDGFEKQLHEMKVTLQDLKRTGVIKNDTYESALRELKSFQAELDNPFNFISKYFEMLNIPGMYDAQKPPAKYSRATTEPLHDKSTSASVTSKEDDSKSDIDTTKKEKKPATAKRSSKTTSSKKTSGTKSNSNTAKKKVKNSRNEDDQDNLDSDTLVTATTNKTKKTRTTKKTSSKSSKKIDDMTAIHKPQGVQVIG